MKNSLRITPLEELKGTGLTTDRILLIKRGCTFCFRVSKVVNRINMKLPLDKRIRIIDGFLLEEFGVNLKPIMDALSKRGFNSYPFLYIEGIIISEAPTPGILKEYLETLLREEILFN